MHITLEGHERLNTEARGWWIDGNVVTITSPERTVRYTLPKGSRRVTMMRLGNDRSQLILGGFKSVTVTVTGPSSTIRALREAVL